MFRFSFSQEITDPQKQCEIIRTQIDKLLNSEALCRLFDLLKTDASTIEKMYGARKMPDGRVIEITEVESLETLEPHRYRLYELFSELEFININKPQSINHDRVVVLGGTQNAVYIRAKAATEFINSSVKSVDGISCYRPINPIERQKTNFEATSDTEFGVMSEVFCSALPIRITSHSDRFKSDRNLNNVSNVRTFECDPSQLECRIYAAPSSEPDIRRADTGDSVLFYLDEGVAPDDRLLFITRNIYCNRQFLQIFHYMLKRDHINSFDVVGCLPDDNLENADDYEITKYIQELIALLSWANKTI